MVASAPGSRSSRSFDADQASGASTSDWVANGKSLPEVARRSAGQDRNRSSASTPTGETIVSVAVPIQRTSAVRGALLLSTQGGDIDSVIASERWAILRFFLVLAAVMFVLSLSLANTIAEPVRKLAEAAERVRRGIKSRQQIPDFTSRSDEIGHLSARAARHDAGALQPHRRDREFRRRRRA